jgi:hypothetical protein
VDSAVLRAAALIVACAVGLGVVQSALADTRSGQGTDARDQQPALDGSFVGDLESLSVSYDTSGLLTATVRFYQPIPANAWDYRLEVKVGTGTNCRPAIDAEQAIGTSSQNLFSDQGFWVTLAGYQGGVFVPQSFSSDGREVSFTFSSHAIADHDFRCASADVLYNYKPHDDLAKFFFVGYAPTTSKPDSAPPFVKALSSKSMADGKTQLRFQVSDNSGIARFEIAIFSRATLVKLLSTGYRRVSKSVENVQATGLTWQGSRKNLASPLRFCVQAWDRAGNLSRTSCAPIASS